MTDEESAQIWNDYIHEELKSSHDIGHNHYFRFLSWKPDRDLNPQYDGIPDIDKCGGIIHHKSNDGTWCASAIHFDTEDVRKVFKPDHLWKVESWEPLTLSPSLLCRRCGDHGFIRDGKWIPA
jgi:hypothetical protein